MPVQVIVLRGITPATSATGGGGDGVTTSADRAPILRAPILRAPIMRAPIMRGESRTHVRSPL